MFWPREEKNYHLPFCSCLSSVEYLFAGAALLGLSFSLAESQKQNLFVKNRVTLWESTGPFLFNLQKACFWCVLYA